ncbi:hypothetical protein AAMO2058_000440500 [Amorphochlora amoebiformis]
MTSPGILLPCFISDLFFTWRAEDAFFMECALECARKGLRAGEVPVGCVIVDINGTILASDHNRISQTGDATQHCEMIALRSSQAFTEDGILEGSTLYVTCEPCIMCAGAIRLCGISRVVFGCKNLQFGGCGSVLSIHNQTGLQGTSFNFSNGLRAMEAAELLRQFYAGKNPRAPEKSKSKKRSGIRGSKLLPLNVE